MPTMTLGRPGMWMDVDVRWCEQVGHVFFGIVLNWRPLKKLVGLLSHNTSNISGLGVPGVPACCSIHYPLIRGLHASHQLLSPSTAALLVRGRRGRCAFRVDLSDIWCRRTWLYLKTMEHLLWMVRNYVYISVILYIYTYVCVCVIVCVFLLQVWGRVSVLNLGKGLWKSECESHSLERWRWTVFETTAAGTVSITFCNPCFLSKSFDFPRERLDKIRFKLISDDIALGDPSYSPQSQFLEFFFHAIPDVPSGKPR